MVRFIALFVIIFLPMQSAFSAPTIDWRVKHPFRYFTETTDFDMHRQALADVMGQGGLPAAPVSALEGKVNDPAWLAKWYQRDSVLYRFPTGAGRPERGWAHHIARRRATCWDHVGQWHSSCRTDTFGTALRSDYVRPQRHTVIFTLVEAPEGMCRWEAGEAIFIVGTGRLARSVELSCAAEVEARIPFEPERPEAERGVAVSVALPDGTTLDHAPVWVRDRLIVGIGDSFSSGEGNPDTPVEIDRYSHRRGLNVSFVYDADSQAIKSVSAYSLPVRFQNVPAGWLDRKCHRSAYSYHLRTALQVALADPKRSAVTFLGYACSGAEVTEGLLLPYAGVETVGASSFNPDGRKRRDQAQVDRLMTELCREDLTRTEARRQINLDTPVTTENGRQLRSISMLNCRSGDFLRQIDMLLVSIGGNDVGFSPLIADVLTKRRPPYADLVTRTRANLNGSVIRTAARLAKAHDVERARERARELPARFAALRKALAPLPIARNAAGKPNILLTAFPRIEFNEDGKLCGEADPRERLEGFNVGGVLSIDVPTLRLVSDFADRVLQPAVKAAADTGNWHFVDSHRDLFRTHGICAQRRAARVSPAESRMLPYYHFASPRNRWSDFDPTVEVRAYAPRQRWFRTLNDICLFVQYKQTGSPPPPSQWGLLDLIESCMGGPFHPTAEGHAHIADAVYARAKSVLNLPSPMAAQVRPEAEP